MAQPGGNEYSSNRCKWVSEWRRCSSGELLRFSSTVDDVKSPKSRLEVAINEERSLSAREAAVV